jgi:hypothetical protein
MSKLWATGIEEFIEFEDTKHVKNEIEDSVEKGERILTRELALTKYFIYILLEAPFPQI